MQAVLEEAGGDIGSPISMPEAAAASATELLAEARERTDALSERAGPTRLEREVGGRQGRHSAYALRTPGKRVRAALVLAAYRAARRPLARPSPASPPRSRQCTPTPWCTTTSPAWTTTTCAAAAPPPTVPFDVATATRAGFLLVPVAARGAGGGGGASWVCPPAPWARWRLSCSRPAASRAWSAGSGSTSRPSAGSSTARRADGGPPGQDRGADPGRLHPGRHGGRGRARPAGRRSPPTARTSASPSRSPTTCSMPPPPARSWARRPAGTRSWPSPPTSVLLGIDGARAEAQRLARRRGRRTSTGRGSVRGTRGPGRVYCDEELVAFRPAS